MPLLHVDAVSVPPRRVPLIRSTRTITDGASSSATVVAPSAQPGRPPVTPSVGAAPLSAYATGPDVKPTTAAAAPPQGSAVTDAVGEPALVGVAVVVGVTPPAGEALGKGVRDALDVPDAVAVCETVPTPGTVAEAVADTTDAEAVAVADHELLMEVDDAVGDGGVT